MPKNTKIIKVVINGFGRVGRAAFKLALENPHLKVVAINDLTDTKTLAYLLKYDSVYGVYQKEVKSDSKNLMVAGAKYPVYAIPEPDKLPWKKLQVDVVLECTGRFTKDGAAKVHIKSGAKKVIISAPVKGKGNIPTYVLGSNEQEYRGEVVISMGSCTTNCIAPVTKVIQDNFGIKQAFFTTVHAYTVEQNLIDGPHHQRDLRRSRAAAQNTVPTSSGAAISVAATQPKLKDRFDGLAIRVPVVCGSLTDLVFVTRTKTSPVQVNTAFKKAARLKELKGYLAVTGDPVVSIDIVGNPICPIIDLSLTQVIGGNFVKVLAWYDNEWAYSARLVDMVGVVADKN